MVFEFKNCIRNNKLEHWDEKTSQKDSSEKCIKAIVALAWVYYITPLFCMLPILIILI